MSIAQALLGDKFKHPVAAYSVAAASSNASVTVNETNFSICAKGADIRYNLGAAATASTFYIPKDETYFIRVQPATTVQALRDASTDGTLLITGFDPNT